MFFSIKKYFRSKKKKMYQSELIEKLNKEHQTLFNIVISMEEAINKKDIKKIKKLVDSFKKELELHLLYEDTNLYEHLYNRYYYYENVRDVIQDKHNEMKDIAKAVQGFIETHQNLDDLEAFNKDFQVVKDVLVKRVSFEEEVLYDIYNKIYKIDTILEKFKGEEA